MSGYERVAKKVFPAHGRQTLQALVLTGSLRVLVKARATRAADGSLSFKPEVVAVLEESREDGSTSERDIAAMSTAEALGLPSASLMWQNVILYLRTSLNLSVVVEDRGKIQDACAAARKKAIKCMAVLMADTAMSFLTEDEISEARMEAVMLQVMET